MSFGDARSWDDEEYDFWLGGKLQSKSGREDLSSLVCLIILLRLVAHTNDKIIIDDTLDLNFDISKVK